MTKEEAKRRIEICRNFLANNYSDMGEPNFTAFNMAIEALEQEPKQVELEGDGYADGEIVYDYGKCPSCGWQFEDGDKDWGETYCCHCGQKLQWFEESEE